MPEKEVIGYLKMIASALAYVHEKGFVHLAVEPSNLLVFSDGEIKLSNFRTGRREGRVWDSTEGDGDHPVPRGWLPWEFLYGYRPLRSAMRPVAGGGDDEPYPGPDGQVKLSSFRTCRREGHRWDSDYERYPGHVGWLPYEFFLGRMGGSAADVYMLGVTCYYCLMGSQPFDNFKDILTKSPEPLPASVSTPFRAFMERMLSKYPDDRPTCGEILAQPWLQSRREILAQFRWEEEY